MDKNGSDFPERAAVARDLRDAEILDRFADRLNREAVDVLDYQGIPKQIRRATRSWCANPASRGLVCEGYASGSP